MGMYQTLLQTYDTAPPDELASLMQPSCDTEKFMRFSLHVTVYYIYIYIYVCVYIYIYIYISVCKSMCVSSSVYVLMHMVWCTLMYLLHACVCQSLYLNMCNSFERC